MESLDVWTKVDHYFEGHLLPGDSAMDEVLQACADAGLPPHQVSASQGKLLSLLARAISAVRILEVGTLGGYSTIWLARGLSTNGRVTTVECNEEYAEIARANFKRAGVEGSVRLRLGSALTVLPSLAEEAPFDLSFIDADKVNNWEYFSWALKLSRPGSMIIVDNVVRDGKVLDSDSDDASVQGVCRLVEMLAGEGRVDATAIQTVGAKGYDGFILATVNEVGR